MGRAEANIIVGASAEAVWNLLNDIDHTPEWVVGLVDAEMQTQGKYGVGSVYVDHNRIGPIPQVTPWTVTEFDPMSRQVHESDSNVLPSTMIINLGRVSKGTHIQMIVKYRFMPFLGPISAFIEKYLMDKMLKQVLKQNLANLNTYLLYHYLSNRQAEVEKQAAKQVARPAERRSTGVAAQVAVR
jgi:hypothetical protein